MKQNNLDDLIDALPREVQPDRDLWPGIEHAIEMRASESATPWRYMPVAAVLMVFVLATWMFSTHRHDDHGHFDGVELATLIEDMDSDFSMKKAALLDTYKGQPALTGNWREQLQELEEARLGIKELLKSSPNNVYMIQIMQNIQQQQLDLIERVHAQVHQGV